MEANDRDVQSMMKDPGFDEDEKEKRNKSIKKKKLEKVLTK
jgi:hypothetical protein